MKISHVGSLPFLDIPTAMDFTFQFDIPVLFTLPKLDEAQYMGRDIKVLKKSKQLPYEKIFLENMSKRSQTQFKFQLIGPVSFQKYFAKDRSLKEVSKELSDLYSPIVSRFKAQSFDPLFFLDEPGLSNIEEVVFLNQFKEELNFSGVHCCNKIDLSVWSKLNVPLKQLDWSLYPNDSLPLDNLWFGGLEKREVLPELGEMSSCVLTPACGLANSLVPTKVFSRLKGIKASLTEH